MTYSRLELINHTLSLIGENKLTTSDNQLGTLVTNILNTAISTVAQETRHNCFEKIEQPVVTVDDYLSPSYDIPDSVIQILGVNCRVSVKNFGDVLDVLPYIELSDLDVELGYSVVNGSIYISKNIARPLTLFIHTIQTKELPENDGDLVKLPNQVVYATAHTAASILCLSYLDNPNAASVQRNLAQTLIEKLTKQQGIGRSKSFNLKPKNNKLRGLTTQYKAIQYLDRSTADGFYLSQKDAVDNYLSQVNAANTYLTQANATNNYLTQINAANTYLTQVNAANTYQTKAEMTPYATLESPIFTGEPTAPTAPTDTDTTQIATTNFVKQAISAYLQEKWDFITLENGWGHYYSDFPTAAFRKIGDIVYIKGLLTASSVPSSPKVICYMPDSCKPEDSFFLLTNVGSFSGRFTANILVDKNKNSIDFHSVNEGFVGDRLSYLSINLSYCTRRW